MQALIPWSFNIIIIIVSHAAIKAQRKQRDLDRKIKTQNKISMSTH